MQKNVRTMRLLLVGTWHVARMALPTSHPLNWHRPAFAEARPQPDAELVRVPVLLLQVWIHRCRALHGREDGCVPLQRGPQRREVLAEPAQRSAAIVLDEFVPRVAPHGTEECRRRGLRRQTGPGRGRLVPQQVVQRGRGSPRNVRVGASGGSGAARHPTGFFSSKRKVVEASFAIIFFTFTLFQCFFSSISSSKTKAQKEKTSTKTCDSLATPTWLQFGSFRCAY